MLIRRRNVLHRGHWERQLSRADASVRRLTGAPERPEGNGRARTPKQRNIAALRNFGERRVDPPHGRERKRQVDDLGHGRAGSTRTASDSDGTRAAKRRPPSVRTKSTKLGSPPTSTMFTFIEKSLSAESARQRWPRSRRNSPPGAPRGARPWGRRDHRRRTHCKGGGGVVAWLSL